MLSAAHPRRGFTLLEITIVLTVMVLLAALVVPRVTSRVRSAEVAAVSQDLQALTEAIVGFRGNVGRYPSTLLQLTDSADAAPDLCGNTVIDDLAKLWRGPYVNRTLVGGGLRAGDALILNDLTRIPATIGAGSPVGSLVITVTGVDTGVAEEVQERFDADGDPAAGSVRWTPAAGQVTLLFHIPVKGC